MTRRWLAIVNPIAGAGRTRRHYGTLHKAMASRGLRIEAVYTKEAGDATRLARDAGGFDGVLSVGGDGTLNEVLNGLQSHAAPLLAVAPLGTGNDFARRLRLPTEPYRLADLVLRAPVQRVRIGEVAFEDGGVSRTCRFLNSAGMGLDAAVLDRLPRGVPPGLAYLVGTLRALPSFRAQETTADLDGRLRRGRHLLLYAGLGTHAGGGMCLTPHAMGDERLAVTLIPEVPVWRLLGALPALYQGRIGRLPWITCEHSAQVCFDAPGWGIEADGQRLGSHRATLRVLPWRLSVVAENGGEADNGTLPS